MSSDRDSTDDDLAELTQQLQELDLQRERLERRRRTLIHRINERASNSTPATGRTSGRPYLDLNVHSNRVDREGTRLYRWDRVEFLTTGAQSTNEGWIESFGNRFAKCIDDNRHPVNKEPKNLRRLGGGQASDLQQLQHERAASAEVTRSSSEARGRATSTSQ